MKHEYQTLDPLVPNWFTESISYICFSCVFSGTYCGNFFGFCLLFLSMQCLWYHMCYCAWLTWEYIFFTRFSPICFSCHCNEFFRYILFVFFSTSLQHCNRINQQIHTGRSYNLNFKHTFSILLLTDFVWNVKCVTIQLFNWQ